MKRHPYDQWAPDARALDLVGDKWTLLIIRDLAGGPRRFVELQRVLPGISMEQLRSRLNRMVADGLLTRQRYREVPPRVDYELTERAQELMPVLGALARWGHDWAWGVPREGEAIDVGAIFRLAPGLLSAARSLRGTTELVVTDRLKDGSTCHYTLVTSSGRVQIFERPSPDAEARVTADEATWVRALGPDADRGGLAVEGDGRLAEALLDGLVGSGGESAVGSAAA
ncbi:MAG: winged helix-turn-helix transcriptional regulator [Solirubrobacteraceae bacterium]